MLDYLSDPELQQYVTGVTAGDVLFLEGDDSQDMYILLSGQLDVIKGQKKIFEITRPGAFFGEMSSLLNERRTATIKVREDARIIRIPCDRVQDVMRRIPGLANEIAQVLAQRLRDTSNMVCGLQELCDQLPDAVIITTDREQRIISWNSAAEKLYGRTAETMRNLSLADIYDDPASYAQMHRELSEGKPITSKVLRFRHSDGSQRYVSLSTTALYDGHHNIQGVLFLGRDVTPLRDLEKKYRKIRNSLFPVLALIVIMTSLFLWAYPHFTRGTQLLDHRQKFFRDRVFRDYEKLASSLANPLARDDCAAVQLAMERYFAESDPTEHGVVGLLLLDSGKQVLAAYSDKVAGGGQDLVGSSYGGIVFEGDHTSPLRVLTFFRPTRERPMGEQQTELAFVLENNGKSGWLLFQLDMEWLGAEYGIAPDELKKINFTNTR